MSEHVVSRVTMTSLRAGISLVAVGVLLAGCASSAEPDPDKGAESSAGTSEGSFAELEAAAIEEGELTVYSGSGESQIEALVGAFMDQYPEISVEYFRGAGTALLNRFSTEMEAGTIAADVFMPVVQPSFVDEHAEWFVPLNDEVLPAMEGWPEEFKTALTVQAAVEEVAITYNTETVENPPTSWEDVLDPQYKGRLILIDPAASPGYMSWYHILRERLGDDFITSLGEMEPMWVDTGAVGAQQVATGQYDMVVPSYPSHGASLIDQGAPLDLVRSLDPTQGVTTSIALVADSPNPSAGRLFANWLLSPEAYEIYCADGVYSSTIEGTSCPSVSENHIDPVYDLPQEEQEEIIALLGR